MIQGHAGMGRLWPIGLGMAVALSLFGCKSPEERERELKEKVAAEASAKTGKNKELAEKAKPKVEALRKIVADAEKQPEPTTPPDKSKFDPAKIELVRLDYLKQLVASEGMPKLEPNYPFFGATAESAAPAPWLKALRNAAKGDAEGYYDLTDDYAKLDALKHVLVLRVAKFVAPVVKDQAFDGGVLLADAFVYDVAAGTSIGGFKVAAQSSDTVDFQYQKEGEKDKTGANAVFWDFQKQVNAAVLAQLGVKPAESK